MSDIPTFDPKTAYFSMEIALDPSIPSYSGGLGVLAGDTLRAAADLGFPIVGVTLLYKKGYFCQSLNAAGIQSERPEQWNPAEKLHNVGPLCAVTIEGRRVRVAAWRYQIHGVSGHEVPIYLLDTDLVENAEQDRRLTDSLYGGDDVYRLSQEIVLGIGGYGVLRKLGYANVATYHMNEGHSALLTLALIEAQLAGKSCTSFADADLVAVRNRCVFTTHTPVPAGHDQFSKDLVDRVLGKDRARLLDCAGCYHDGSLNMTYVALRCSHYINGVAMRHGEVSRGMFPGYPISAITNGVHAVSWTALPFRELFDQHVAPWRRDNRYLRYAIGISVDDVRRAHQEAKRSMLEALRSRAGVELHDKVFTLGFARRAAVYKRPELLFSDIERLKWIARQVGPLQIVYGGRAHPHDQEGKATIQHIFAATAALKGIIPVVYVENYDLQWGQILTSGVDLWLNTPKPPEEASGTSGMKAALNGVPSLSVLDGWWIEGCIEGVTGWAIGADAPSDPKAEASSLYAKLDSVILPMFYGRPNDYGKIMRFCIALNGGFFNTQRMLSQYISNAYSTDCWGHWPTRVDNIPVPAGDKSSPATNRQTG
jgi:starch phosphorylase